MALRRGTGLVLTLILIAVIVSISAVAISALLVGAGPVVREGSTLVLQLSGDLAEVDRLGALGPFLPRRPTLRSMVDAIARAKTDRRIKGLLVVPGTSPGLWAKTQELRQAVVDFRRSGKPAIAFLEFGGEQEYFLATACDRIYLLPTSPLDLRGIARYELFLRGTLDKIGARPDLVHIGDYKTAVNTYTEKGFTEAHREMAESLNRDTFDQLVDTIAEARRKTPDDVRALIDRGPFLPQEALDAGLVDALAYRDEVATAAGLKLDDSHRVAAHEFAKGASFAGGLSRGSRIAVIYIVGPITSGRSGLASDGETTGSDTITEYVRRARADASVKAIVLRIDSPGGSSIASDVIWRELMLARAKKPVIASMSDLAASGGYYVALPAHAIVAQPGTLTGSIGIYAGKMVVAGTFDKLGVGVDGVEHGRMAGMNSPVRPYTDDERAKLTSQIKAFYEQFLVKVAESRKSTPERIDQIAQGRVWTGRQARELGLVDELGGLDRAIAIARERAKIPSGERVDLVVYPTRKTLYELWSDPWSGGRALVSTLAGHWLSDEERAVVSGLQGAMHLFRRGEPLALMPYVFVR